MPISPASWAAHLWKNELYTQMQRTLADARDVLGSAFEGDHDPLAMMERALALSAFAIHRLVEKKLVSDGLAASRIAVRSFAARVPEGPPPTPRGSLSRSAFADYDLSAQTTADLTPGELANEILSSPKFSVMSDEEDVPDGLLIESGLTRRLLHLTLGEFEAYALSVLDDIVGTSSDRLDPATGIVTYERHALAIA